MREGLGIKGLWRIYVGLMEDFMDDLWRIYAGFMEDLWRIYAGFMEDLWTFLSVSLKVERVFLILYRGCSTAGSNNNAIL